MPTEQLPQAVIDEIAEEAFRNLSCNELQADSDFPIHLLILGHRSVNNVWMHVIMQTYALPRAEGHDFEIQALAVFVDEKDVINAMKYLDLKEGDWTIQEVTFDQAKEIALNKPVKIDALALQKTVQEGEKPIVDTIKTFFIR